MLSVLLLTCIITTSHFWPTEGAGVSEGRDCVIEAHFTSPYINAYFERVALVTGCVSTENNPQSQEVHVISLIGGHQAPSTTAEVTLHIRPQSDTGIHNGPLIFVLNSHLPVKWIIRAERISNQTRNKFIIGRESRLEKDPSIRIKIKKVDLPLDTDGLAAWTRRSYKALTSFAEVEQANSFLKKVGRDNSAPTSCNISANFFDASSKAAYLQPQPMAGCAAIGNEGQNERDVHIIELRSGNLNSHNQQEAGIFLDIKTKSRSSRSSNKKIMLVLKTHNPIRWHIRTRGVRNMVVLTDQPAEVVPSQGPRPQSVQMARENFGNHEEEGLIRRVQEGDGPIVSYTNMRLANRIDLYLDGARDFQQPKPNQNRWQDRIPKSPFDNPGRTRSILQRAKMVTCNEHGITVVFKKVDLRRAGIRLEHLSFKNTSCIPRSSDTQYVLHSGPDECNTERLPEADFTNAIQVNHIDESALELEDEGSAYSADLMAAASSGFILDDTHVDDEDYSSSATPNAPIAVPVKCHVDRTSSILPKSEIETDYTIYILEAYQDRAMTRNFTFPHDMNNDMIYVRAKVNKKIEDNLQARIDTCWLSEYNSKEEKSEKLLINRGCLIDESVEWLATDAAFGINLSRMSHSRRVSRGYLNCKLSVCGKDNTNGISQCQSQAEYCDQQPSRKDVRIKSLGEFVFLNHAPDPTNQPLQNLNQECQQVQKIEGLDSPTVVGIAFAAFIIGVLLTAALWFIHTHTGPMRKQNRPRSTETSGESTPSSTAPITIHQIHT